MAARAGPLQVGRRNQVLNRAAFVLGQIVGGGHLAPAVVASLLDQARVAVGVSSRETTQTVESGLGAGEANPRSSGWPPLPAWQCLPQQAVAVGVGDDTRSLQAGGRDARR